jgi:ATPase subunit of ABC transporter with duplicated ATPase domains
MINTANVLLVIARRRTLQGRAARMGIVVEHISKSYDGKKILEDISFEVKNSQLVTFFHANGGGPELRLCL